MTSFITLYGSRRNRDRPDHRNHPLPRPGASAGPAVHAGAQAICKDFKIRSLRWFSRRVTRAQNFCAPSPRGSVNDLVNRAMAEAAEMDGTPTARIGLSPKTRSVSLHRPAGMPVWAWVRWKVSVSGWSAREEKERISRYIYRLEEIPLWVLGAGPPGCILAYRRTAWNIISSLGRAAEFLRM